MTKGKPQLHMVALTDPGKVRHINEDAVFIAPDAGLAILADGMGGYSAGEKASALTIETVSRILLDTLPRVHQLPDDEADQALREDIAFAVKRANIAIRTEASRDVECEGMGSTVVIAVFLHGRLIVGHVGDSRMYLYRAGELSQITRDHSWLQEQLDLGVITAEAAKSSRFKNLVTRGLGIDDSVEAEINTHTTQVDDIYLLCSDGLSDMVDKAGIASVLQSCGQDIEHAVARLIALANDNGGRDNVSAILVCIHPPRAGWLRGLVGRIRS